MDRLSLCEMHEAVDSLHHANCVLPVLANFNIRSSIPRLEFVVIDYVNEVCYFLKGHFIACVL